MANYAEQLAYWYLRLNGFFPLSDYTYHQIQEDTFPVPFSADAGLLAIRPPYYSEDIPVTVRNEWGQEQDSWAQLASDEWLGEFEGKWLGVIVEVKGNDHTTKGQIARAFASNKLKISLKRLGLIPSVDDALRVLMNASRYDFEKVSIIKLVFSQYTINGPWETVLLWKADDFIQQNVVLAMGRAVKHAGRYFLSSEFLQYVIWSSQNRGKP